MIVATNERELRQMKNRILIALEKSAFSLVSLVQISVN